MKILLVHNNYQSKSIGGEDVVFQHEFSALEKCLGTGNVFKYVVYNDDINIFKLLFTIWFSRKHYNNIYKLVSENKIDLVHVHNFYPLLTPSVFRAAKKAGAKTIQTLHNYRWWCISGIFYRNNCGICELCAHKKFPYFGIIHKCYRNSFLQSIFTALALFFYKLTNQIKHIDKFFVLSDSERKKIIELGISSEKIIFKPNFVEVESVVHDGKKDYIYVGKLDESKGVLELLKTWKKLDKKYVLRLIGEGELSNRSDALKSDNIIFLGKLDNKDTLKEIAKARYLISPSLMFETFGLTVLEAMSLGVPVIGFNIGTRLEFIKDGVNGFISSVENLKNMIEKSYDFDDYSRLSENARKFADNYSKDKIIKDQISIYQKIINNNL